MKIAFVWQGVSDKKIFNQWNDGLREAIRILGAKVDIGFYEPWEDIKNVDLIMYWEAPCTINGSNAPHYNKVRLNPIKKILLFAGGQIKKEWVEGFDLLCVESKINAEECAALNIPHITAFGINDNVFKKQSSHGCDREWTGVHHGTSASWKRQWLLAEALGEDALIVGRYQPEDPEPFDRSRRAGATVIDQQPAWLVADYLNACLCLVQTSDFWGGGQRATLEAMACGLPVICMNDSPKNREYVEESGAGIVCHPSKEQIRLAVEEVRKHREEMSKKAIDYVKSKWTAEHYAEALEKAINVVLNNLA